MEPQEHNDEFFVLDVVYKRHVINKKGNVRLKDLPAILTEAGVSFDETRISENDWYGGPVSSNSFISTLVVGPNFNPNPIPGLSLLPLPFI